MWICGSCWSRYNSKFGVTASARPNPLERAFSRYCKHFSDTVVVPMLVWIWYESFRIVLPVPLLVEALEFEMQAQ